MTPTERHAAAPCDPRLSPPRYIECRDSECVRKTCSWCGNEVCTHFGCREHKLDCRWVRPDQKEAAK